MNTRAKHFSTSRATIFCREYVLVCSAHLAERLFFEQHFGMDASSIYLYSFRVVDRAARAAVIGI